jgi:hypothetical protein
MIVARRRENLITATQHVLSHDLRRYVRIAGLGEIAVRGAADEAAFSLRIEPACCLSIRNDRRDRRTLTSALLLAAWCVGLPTTATTATTAALPTASALIATATSIVTVIALARMSATAAIALLLPAPLTA